MERNDTTHDMATGLSPVDTDQYKVAVRDNLLTICNTASTRFAGYHPTMK